jgi:hypothetical protein
VIENKLPDEIVKALRRNARRRMRGDHVEASCGEAPGGAHAGEVLRPVELDFAGFHVLAVVGVGVLHGRVSGLSVDYLAPRAPKINRPADTH